MYDRDSAAQQAKLDFSGKQRGFSVNPKNLMI